MVSRYPKIAGGDMKFHFAVAVSVFAATAVSGQALNDRVGVVYSAGPSPHVLVTNKYSSPLTGVVIVTTGLHGGKGITGFDSAINFHHDHPIEPGQSQAFQLLFSSSQDPSSLQPQVMAVTFSDFTVAGDADWIARFHSRRLAVYREIAAVSSALDRALSDHESVDQIANDLKNLRLQARATVPDKHSRASASLVTEAAITNLERGGVRGQAGDPRQTVQAVILPLFADWRAALQRYDNSIR